MPLKITCSSCQHVQEVDAVPQATFNDRLKGLAEQRDGFKKEADDLRTERDRITSESATWRRDAEELVRLRSQAEEDAAFSAAGLAVQQPHHRAYTRSLYEAEVPKEGEGEKPTFAEWLKAHVASESPDPMLLALRGGSGTTNPGPSAATTPKLFPTPGEKPPAPGGQTFANLQASWAARTAAGGVIQPEELEAAKKLYPKELGIKPTPQT